MMSLSLGNYWTVVNKYQVYTAERSYSKQSSYVLKMGTCQLTGNIENITQHKKDHTCQAYS